MPTRNRRRFVHQSIEYFLRQDYPSRELIIVDDGQDPVADLVPQEAGIRYIHTGYPLTIGAKRNLACSQARGSVLLHWDDDDWSAPWRVSYQTKHLLLKQGDVCGLHQVYHYNLRSRQGLLYIYANMHRLPWLAGNSLAYRRDFWERNPFLNINIGEDSHFLWSSVPKQLISLPRNDFLVALIHTRNISPKGEGPSWFPYPEDKIRSLVGRDWDTFEALANADAPSQAGAGGGRPLVSCIMPTYNRRRFVPQAIRYFLDQDYPNRELIILDDGEDPVRDLVPEDGRIRYVQLSHKQTVGVKRNLASALAGGEIILFWDDDDWYRRDRIRYQVEPILNGEADLTAFGLSPMYSVGERRFWSCSESLYNRMFVDGVHAGTLAYRKQIWSSGTRFPDDWLAEDANFMMNAVQKGHKLRKLPNPGVFVYLRHRTNSWQFQPGTHLDGASWHLMEPPAYIPMQDLQFYQSLDS
jgi:glycosyltransferase involved in cell wall biosynthesis